MAIGALGLSSLDFNPTTKEKVRAKKSDKPVDLEHMYARPKPDVFSKDWNDGYNAAWDGEPFKVIGTDWADGYHTGQIAQREDARVMDATGSSNA